MNALKLFSFLRSILMITISVFTRSTIFEKQTVVFEHGFLADGFCWDYQIAALQVKVCHVVSLQNPVTSPAKVN